MILDEPQDLEVYGTYLRDRGYETLTCLSPIEGTNFLETETVSLVIVSQGTPAFEGRQVLEWIGFSKLLRKLIGNMCCHFGM
jgi:DNA-binding response OmpR family regulator